MFLYEKFHDSRGTIGLVAPRMLFVCVHPLFLREPRNVQVALGVPVRDLLLPLVSATDEATGRAALELYARRIYRTHVVDNFSWIDRAEGAHC